MLKDALAQDMLLWLYYGWMREMGQARGEDSVGGFVRSVYFWGVI